MKYNNRSKAVLLLKDGTIFWKDQQVLGPSFHLVPGMDFFKYVAQDFDLMPFITVAENVGKYLSNIYTQQILLIQKCITLDLIRSFDAFCPIGIAVAIL